MRDNWTTKEWDIINAIDYFNMSYKYDKLDTVNVDTLQEKLTANFTTHEILEAIGYYNYEDFKNSYRDNFNRQDYMTLCTTTRVWLDTFYEELGKKYYE